MVWDSAAIIDRLEVNNDMLPESSCMCAPQAGGVAARAAATITRDGCTTFHAAGAVRSQKPLVHVRGAAWRRRRTCAGSDYVSVTAPTQVVSPWRLLVNPSLIRR